MPIDIEFNEAKDAANARKHGVSLALGALVLKGTVGEIEDRRREYGEERWNAFGLVNGRLFVCTYTRRGETRRIISLRKANKREQRLWLS